MFQQLFIIKKNAILLTVKVTSNQINVKVFIATNLFMLVYSSANVIQYFNNKFSPEIKTKDLSIHPFYLQLVKLTKLR